MAWVWGPVCLWKVTSLRKAVIGSWLAGGRMLAENFWEWAVFAPWPNTRYLGNYGLEKVLVNTVPSLPRRLAREGFSEPDVAVIASPHMISARRCCAARISLFHCTGAFWRFQYPPRLKLALKSLVVESDATVVVSSGSKKELLMRYDVEPSRVFVVEHGADPAGEYSVSGCSAHSQDQSAVLVGIPQTTDVLFLANVARLLPAVSFHIIGPFTVEFRRLFSGRQNVVFHGVLPHDRVAASLPRYGVGLICYNSQTLAKLAPGETGMKFYDYLAAGLPVASVPLVAFDGKPWPVVTASTAPEFAAAITSCLERRQELSEMARACARNLSWTSRVDEFEVILTSLLRKRQ